MEIQRDLQSVVKQYLSELKSKIDNDTSWVLPHIARNGFNQEFRKQLKAYDIKKYIYMVTFTISPKLHSVITEDLKHEVEQFIEKTPDRKPLKVLNMQYVCELHKDGRPHYHSLIVTERPLAKDRFNYYIGKYGNIDVAKNKQGSTEEILNYISKSGVPKILL